MEPKDILDLEECQRKEYEKAKTCSESGIRKKPKLESVSLFKNPIKTQWGLEGWGDC